MRELWSDKRKFEIWLEIETLASEAMAAMRPLRIDELPVVDDDDRPIGLIDIQDLVMLKMLDVDEKSGE